MVSRVRAVVFAVAFVVIPLRGALVIFVMTRDCEAVGVMRTNGMSLT